MPTWAYLAIAFALIVGLLYVAGLCAAAGQADEDMGAKERLR